MWGWGRSAKEAYLVRGLVVGMAPFGMQYGTCLPSVAAAAKSLQSCPTLCDRIDRSPPGPAVPGILQARTLEWVAISFSNAWKWKVKVRSLSRVRLSVTPWTAAFQAPPSMGFSRQTYWSGVPLPSPWSPFNKHTATFTLPKVTDFSKLWPPCDGIPSQH